MGRVINRVRLAFTDHKDPRYWPERLVVTYGAIFFIVYLILLAFPEINRPAQAQARPAQCGAMKTYNPGEPIK